MALIRAKPRLINKYKGSLGLWAKTSDAHLSVHNACNLAAPAHRLGFDYVRWMIKLMDEELAVMHAAAVAVELPSSAAAALSSTRVRVKLTIAREGATIHLVPCIGPKGFHKEKRYDVDLLRVAVQTACQAAES